MNAYQWKQEAFGAAVDRGLYNLASQIDETNTADFSGGIPWYIIRAIADEQQRLTPSKSPPERSGTTGHNRTLTRAQKCAIIIKKAMRRHVRRWKRKQEGKKMKIDNIIKKINNSCKPFDFNDLREIFTAANSAEGLKLLKRIADPDDIPIDIIDSALYDLGYCADDAGTYRKL